MSSLLPKTTRTSHVRRTRAADRIRSSAEVRNLMLPSQPLFPRGSHCTDGQEGTEKGETEGGESFRPRLRLLLILQLLSACPAESRMPAQPRLFCLLAAH